MKVLQINSVCGIRSTGRICTDIADILTANGHECKIAYGRESVPEEYQKYAVRIGCEISVKLDAAKTRLFDNAGFNSKSATKKFIKWVKEYDPDVIHLHNIHGYYLNVEILFDYLKKAGKPVIWTLHDCWSFTGHCSHFEYIGCNKWKDGCFTCPQKGEYPASLLTDNSRNNYLRKNSVFTGVPQMTVVTPSKWLSNLVKQSYLSEYTVEVINNGIDLDIFKPTESDFRQKYALEDKTIILGVASSWSEKKGLNDFVKLSQILDDSFKIVLIGLTEGQLKALPDNVLGITKTNNARELAEIYTAADLFVNPTYDDNYPTVNLEAQACGTPVITYNTGGSVESVPSENIVPQGDLNLLMETIKNVSCLKTITPPEKFAQYQEYIALYKGKIYNESFIIY